MYRAHALHSERQIMLGNQHEVAMLMHAQQTTGIVAFLHHRLSATQLILTPLTI
jgi:hypothetical protein